jgi:hypothetical protein
MLLRASTKGNYVALENPSVSSAAQRSGEAAGGIHQGLPMHLIDRFASGEQDGEVVENARQQKIVDVDFGHALLRPGSNQAYQHPSLSAFASKSPVAAETAHIELIGAIDRDFGFISYRMHRRFSPVLVHNEAGGCRESCM